MNLNIIPPDSLLTSWCKILSCTEVPVSYQIVGGLSMLGALLKRQIWVDQKNWKVYPCQPVLFVGPSGIGKDTIINRITDEIGKVGGLPILGGRTMEGIYDRLRGLGALAACYLPAGELSAFFGNRDYQSGMIQDFTNLLSCGERVDITTKSMLHMEGRAVYIYKPTITLHGGSTVEWLHKAMPDGTMEGGFLGRFLIVVEDFGTRHIALPKRDIDVEDLHQADLATTKWAEGIHSILGHYKGLGKEFHLTTEAEWYYTNWYHNRFKYFSKTVLPYANRSRDMVLRLAMLMAVSRQHWNWMDEEDVRFGSLVLNEVGKYIDKVILPPTNEAQCGRMILQILPATSSEIWTQLNVKFPLRVIQTSLEVLSQSGQIAREGKVWKRKEEHEIV